MRAFLASSFKKKSKYDILKNEYSIRIRTSNMKQTIILLYGGRSAEREVSVLSAESVMRAVSGAVVDYDVINLRGYLAQLCNS